MSIFGNSTLVAIAISCLTLTGKGAAPSDTAQPELSETALRLIAAAYPELRDQGATAHIEGHVRRGGGPWMREFAVEIRDFKDKGVETLAPLTRLRAVLFNAVFDFRDNGLDSYSARGRTVMMPENERFGLVLAKHPTWSEAEVAAGLASRGAAFGPAAAREMAEEANRLAGSVAYVFGYGAIMVTEVTFEFPSAHDRKSGSGRCFWRVVYKPPSEGSDVELRASFEPFAGKLVSLSRSM